MVLKRQTSEAAHGRQVFQHRLLELLRDRDDASFELVLLRSCNFNEKIDCGFVKESLIVCTFGS